MYTNWQVFNKNDKYLSKTTKFDIENSRQITISSITSWYKNISFKSLTIGMKPLKHLLVNIIVNGVVLYAIVHYVPELWFKIQTIYKDTYIIFGILGVVFRLINSVLKSILKILTLPIRLFTLWLFSLLLNIIVLYIFEQTVNYLDIGIIVQLGTLIQTFVLSVILSAIYFLIKKII